MSAKSQRWRVQRNFSVQGRASSGVKPMAERETPQSRKSGGNALPGRPEGGPCAKYSIAKSLKSGVSDGLFYS